LRGWGAAVIAAVLLGAGCTGDPSTPPVPPVTTTASPPAASVRLHATLLQYRPDEGTNRLEVEFTNEGRDPVTVRSVRISWADARGAPRTPKDTTYAPGQTIDLTTTYGVAVCDQPRPIEPPHAVATLDDGSTIDVALDRHGSDMLKRSHAHDCALQRLSDTASVSLSTTFRRVHLNGEDYLSGNLLLRRPAGRAGTSGDAVTVSDLTGSALLTFVAPPSQPLPATLRPAGSHSWTSPYSVPPTAVTTTAAARAPRPSSSAHTSGSATTARSIGSSSSPTRGFGPRRKP